jgi:hypothetical protein
LSGSGVAPRVAFVTEFLVELSVSPTKANSVAQLLNCGRVAAEEQRQRGGPVRCVRAISVPEEQTCFVFYDAPSREGRERDRTTREVPLRVRRRVRDHRGEYMTTFRG